MREEQKRRMELQKTEELTKWEEQLGAFAFPKWNELPEIDLYMDQVVSYLGQKLSVFYETPEAEEEDNRYITATMINNYVKQKLIDAPVKKRYDRTRVSELMILFCAKYVLSIGQCGDFIAVCRTENDGPQEMYDRFRTVFEQILHNMAHHTLALPDSGTDALLSRSPVMTTTAIAFVNKLYAEKLLSLSAPAKTEPEKQEKKETKKKEDKGGKKEESLN